MPKVTPVCEPLQATEELELEEWAEALNPKMLLPVLENINDGAGADWPPAKLENKVGTVEAPKLLPMLEIADDVAAAEEPFAVLEKVYEVVRSVELLAPEFKTADVPTLVALSMPNDGSLGAFVSIFVATGLSDGKVVI